MGLRDVGRKESEESQCAQLSLQVTPGMEASGYSCTVGVAQRLTQPSCVAQACVGRARLCVDLPWDLR